VTLDHRAMGERLACIAAKTPVNYRPLIRGLP
jgi:hypothetical protein